MSKAKYEDLEKKLESMQNEIVELKNALNAKANVKIIYNCDMNELDKQGSGLYIAYSQLQNTPITISTMHYYVLQICYNTGFCMQIIIPLHSYKTIHVRRKSNGTWEGWTQLHAY